MKSKVNNQSTQPASTGAERSGSRTNIIGEAKIESRTQRLVGAATLFTPVFSSPKMAISQELFGGDISPQAEVARAGREAEASSKNPLLLAEGS